ncbi:MAG: hypothetical protein IPO33_02870 [Saprospiraceae bacterium]|nr:hypothetical protein [Candidatus Brachybacter algidus]
MRMNLLWNGPRLNLQKYSQDVFVIKNLEEVKANSKNRTANNQRLLRLTIMQKISKYKVKGKEFPLEIKA